MIMIESPVKGYTGISAGVGFALGKAMVKELTPTQKRYFEKKGYSIKEEDEKNINENDFTKVSTENINNGITANNADNSGASLLEDLGDIE